MSAKLKKTKYINKNLILQNTMVKNLFIAILILVILGCNQHVAKTTSWSQEELGDFEKIHFDSLSMEQELKITKCITSFLPISLNNRDANINFAYSESQLRLMMSSSKEMFYIADITKPFFKVNSSQTVSRPVYLIYPPNFRKRDDLKEDFYDLEITKKGFVYSYKYNTTSLVPVEVIRDKGIRDSEGHIPVNKYSMPLEEKGRFSLIDIEKYNKGMLDLNNIDTLNYALSGDTIFPKEAILSTKQININIYYLSREDSVLEVFSPTSKTKHVYNAFNALDSVIIFSNQEEVIFSFSKIEYTDNGFVESRKSYSKRRSFDLDFATEYSYEIFKSFKGYYKVSVVVMGYYGGEEDSVIKEYCNIFFDKDFHWIKMETPNRTLNRRIHYKG
jgi:hypothetical protein